MISIGSGLLSHMNILREAAECVGERRIRVRRSRRRLLIRLDLRRKGSSLADIGEGMAMNDEDRELGNRLFATATAMLEDAIEVAVAGQSSKLNPRQLADRANWLLTVLRDIAVIAEAAMIVANSGINQGRNPRKDAN